MNIQPDRMELVEMCQSCDKPMDDCECNICMQCGSDALRHTECGFVCIDCGQLQESP